MNGTNRKWGSKSKWFNLKYFKQIGGNIMQITIVGFIVSGVFCYFIYSYFGGDNNGNSGDGNDGNPPPLPDEPVPDDLLDELPVSTEDDEVNEDEKIYA